MKLTKSQAANLRRILNIISSGIAGVPNFEITESYYFVCNPAFITNDIMAELNEYGYVVDETETFIDDYMITVSYIKL